MSRRTLFWLILIFGGTATLLHLFVFDAWLVPGGDPMFLASVEPNLRTRDRVLVRRGSPPTSGQLARCASPVPGGTWVVGRAFGAPGAIVEVRDGSVYVSGQFLRPRFSCPAVSVIHPGLQQPVLLTCGIEENGSWSYAVLRSTEVPEHSDPTVVPLGKVFLVSDNRYLHQDSRDFGLLDESTCERIVYRLWGDDYLDGSRRFTILW